MASGAFALTEDGAAVGRGRAGAGRGAAGLAAGDERARTALERCVSAWTGPRSELFDSAARGMAQSTRSAGGACRSAEAALGDLAAAIRRAEDELAELSARYDALPLAVSSGSALVLPTDPLRLRAIALTEQASQLTNELHLVEQRVAGDLEALADVLPPQLRVISGPDPTRRVHCDADSDESLAAAMATLTGALLVGTGGAPSPVPDSHATALDVHRWWATLSSTQREALLRADPGHWGNLDGIPALDRDLANRIALPKELARLRAELSRRFPRGEPAKTVRSYVGDGRGAIETRNPLWTAWDRLSTQLVGVDAIASRLADGAAYLLGFQPRVGLGRAIVSLGNPDTALHTSVLVPGTTARLAGIAADLVRSRAMAVSARAAGRLLARCAHITWYGYDAPQHVLPDAARLEFAANAAPVLERFASALRVTHEPGSRSHTTVVAHSYGTTVVGRAASHGHRLDVDDVVLVASPGVGLGSGWLNDGASVDDLRLSGESRGHVYATRSRSDIIRLAVGTHLGVDPTGRAFGAHVFAADPGDEHDGYWAPADDPALAAMGMVIAGRGDELTTAGHFSGRNPVLGLLLPGIS